jgi:hypothetical protein
MMLNMAIADFSIQIRKVSHWIGGRSPARTSPRSTEHRPARQVARPDSRRFVRFIKGVATRRLLLVSAQVRPPCGPQRLDSSLTQRPSPASTRGAIHRALPCFGKRALPEGDDDRRSSVAMVGWVGNARTETGVNSSMIVMGDPVRQELFQMSLPKRDQEVQAFPPDRSDQPLTDGACLWRSHRCL